VKDGKEVAVLEKRDKQVCDGTPYISVAQATATGLGRGGEIRRHAKGLEVVVARLRQVRIWMVGRGNRRGGSGPSSEWTCNTKSTGAGRVPEIKPDNQRQ
jgi:hypothetical protein